MTSLAPASPSSRSWLGRGLATLTAALAALAGPEAPASAQHERPMAPELSPNLGWLNTDRPLRLRDELKGHVVLLDFWTYCCINCMHILPDLEYLEAKYADEPFVVVGVHSAKFSNEATRESIRQAIQRYHIAHPVVIDDDMAIWRAFGARGWPTFALIGADGRVIGMVSGEGNRAVLDAAVKQALADARESGALAKKRVAITPDAQVPAASGLRFPGKAAAWRRDAGSGYLFISDSSNHRVIVAAIPDEAGRASVIRVVGSGERGFADGADNEAQFNDPQGLAFDDASRTLYVADRANHAIRAVRLDDWRVETIVGDGAQSYDRAGGKTGSAQGLNSPWGLALSPDRATLYVAMAGTHQLWEVELASRRARRLAGSGAENILDGPAAQAALAQPSGLALASDGQTLYFADSEVSAIRALSLATKRVSTIIGEGLFEFGDIDGAYPQARLQHPLGVALWPATSVGASDALFVADTYNHKIKVVAPAARAAHTFIGGGARSSSQDRAASLLLDEPGGVAFLPAPGEPTDAGRAGGTLFIADTNHHRIVAVDIATRAWREVALDGLPSMTTRPDARAWDEGAAVPASIEIDPSAAWTLALDVRLPPGRKVNPEAPMSVRVLAGEVGGGSRVVAQRTLRASEFPVAIDIAGGLVDAGQTLLVEAFFASCAGDLSVCYPEEVRWRVDVGAGDSRDATLAADLSTPLQTGLGKPGGR